MKAVIPFPCFPMQLPLILYPRYICFTLQSSQSEDSRLSTQYPVHIEQMVSLIIIKGEEHTEMYRILQYNLKARDNVQMEALHLRSEKSSNPFSSLGVGWEKKRERGAEKKGKGK